MNFNIELNYNVHMIVKNLINGGNSKTHYLVDWKVSKFAYRLTRSYTHRKHSSRGLGDRTRKIRNEKIEKYKWFKDIGDEDKVMYIR